MKTTVLQAQTAPSKRAVAGKHAASAAPPAYGIDFLDRQCNRPNPTGLPNGLKAGVEDLSGLSMDNVRVHYNSPKPAQLQALAYTQGTDIHVAPGQEKHLAHEAWHVVQQAQGRVQPTVQMKKGMLLNNDDGLEREADIMGEKANSATHDGKSKPSNYQGKMVTNTQGTIQCKVEDAIIYAAYANLNYAYPPSVESFITLLNNLTPSNTFYSGLKQALTKGMSFNEISAIEKKLSNGQTIFDLNLESDEDDEDFEMDYSVKKKKPSKQKGSPDTLSTFNMFKPKKKSGGFLQRPAEYGAVKIKKQTIQHISGQDIHRPVQVSGLVFPTSTSGRPSAPEPDSGIKVGIQWKHVGDVTTHNTGIVDAQKGHIMALELGGPDIPSNIVPQWANWQANGAWRQAEKKVLKLALAAQKKPGHTIFFVVDVNYKKYAIIEQGTLKGLTFPVGFRMQVTELNGKNAIASGQIIFDGEQAQDNTDFKVSGQIFDSIDKMEFEDL